MPQKGIFWTHQDQKKAKIPYIRVLLVFQKRFDFLPAKEWFFWCFLRPCILGTFCRFIPCNLSRLSLSTRRQVHREAARTSTHTGHEDTYTSSAIAYATATSGVQLSCGLAPGVKEKESFDQWGRCFRDWECVCTYLNFNDRTHCRRCAKRNLRPHSTPIQGQQCLLQ